MRQRFDFVVMGAGVVGLCAALALQQRGHSVALLDAGTLETDSTKPEIRAYALNLASQQLLEELGIWAKMKQQIAPYERMVIWDAQSNATLDFDARSLARDSLGVILEERCLKQVLLDEVHARDVSLITSWQTKTLQILEDHVSLSSDVDTVEAAFILISDGAHSPTRSLLKIPMTAWSYQQRALVATVAVEHSHARTAFQVFGQHGPLAFLPLQDLQRCAIVWSSDLAEAKRLMALSDSDFSEQLAQAFEHKLGRVCLDSPRQSYPLHMQHVQQYIGPRWVIMGDAAHSIHPLAGLGLNMGLADITALLQVMRPTSSVLLSPRALRAYQRQRKHALWQTILFLQGIHHLFTQNHAPIKLLRRLGLSLVDELPALKRLFMEQASGVVSKL